MKIVLLLMYLAPMMAVAQNKQDSVWEPLKAFIGNWTGSGNGVPGKAAYETSFEFVMNNKYVEIKNKATYAPTEKNPKGEVRRSSFYKL